jgi:predicted SAM-dependent methyltransferase
MLSVGDRVIGEENRSGSALALLGMGVTRVLARLKQTEGPLARAALLRSAGAAHAARRGHRVRRTAVRRYLAESPEPKLHFGAGPVVLDGWLNSDLIGGDVHLNLERPLPLPAASFAYAFGEHVVEHIAEKAVDPLLRELNRVLRPGGVLRLTTPDLRKLIALYEDRNPETTFERYAAWLAPQIGKDTTQPAQVLNDLMRLWGHRHIFDEPELTARLKAAGFATVERREPLESEHPALRNLERHGGEPWVNRAEAMTLEAVRL